MSGGEWQYFDRAFFWKLQDEFYEDIKKKYKSLAPILLTYGERLCKIIHDIDWAESGDTSIEDKEKFGELAERFLKGEISERVYDKEKDKC